jgi:hypothetical protein
MNHRVDEWTEADVDSLLGLFAISSPDCPRHLHSFLDNFAFFDFLEKERREKKHINDDSRQQHPGGTCRALSKRSICPEFFWPSELNTSL